MAHDPIFDVSLQLALGPRRLDVDLRTDARRIAIEGPSGVGKTSLLRALAGVQPGVTGHCRFMGLTWLDSASATWVPPQQRRVGWVPQDALVFPHVDVRHNLTWGNPSAAAVQRLSDALAITDLLDRRPRHLSGGERQRVALARALLADPRLLLLDEAFSALDRARREEVTQLVLDVCRKDDLALVVVSHDLELLMPLIEQRFTLTEQGLTTSACEA